MKTDVVKIKSNGEGIEEALHQAEAVAEYKRLPKKSALHLRLLSEETVGLARALTGLAEADFWIEDEDGEFRIHLKTRANMNGELRKKLLSMSSSGKNAAAKGIMGKIRDLIERAMEPVDGSIDLFYPDGWVYTGADSDPAHITMAADCYWSLNQYRQSFEDRKDSSEEWDELEKSLVAKLADDVRVGIKDGNVEMIIYKKL
ncbi:MAG: hypothetical protein J5940_06300 [Clostridia bacterium]|nr:hypothetical protein [Clostridia bacterium]